MTGRDFGEVGSLLKRFMMEVSTSDEVAYSVIGTTSSKVESFFVQAKRYDFLEINTLTDPLVSSIGHHRNIPQRTRGTIRAIRVIRG